MRSPLLVLPDWAAVKGKRKAHIQRVAALLDTWAGVMRVSRAERRRWLRAAALHDALKDAPVDVLRELAAPHLGPPGLWHGPAAARQAELAGETDTGVLSAVRYHSVGHASWDRVGRMLYLADYLEPGRRFGGDRRATRVRRVPRDPDGVLQEVACERIARGLADGWPLLPETVGFWNDLV